jgi:hypothetical protein
MKKIESPHYQEVIVLMRLEYMEVLRCLVSQSSGAEKIRPALQHVCKLFGKIMSSKQGTRET